MLPNQPDKLNMSEVLELTDRGFTLLEALYDATGQICDFKIVYANKGMENFTDQSYETLNGNYITKAFNNKYIDTMLAIFTKVVVTGDSTEAEYFSNLRSRYVKTFVFNPMPGCVGCYYEFLSDSRLMGDKMDENATASMQRALYSYEAFWVRKGDKALYVNPAFDRIFGIPGSRLFENIYILLEVVDVRDYNRVLEMLRNDGSNLETSYNIEFRINHPNRGTIWIWLKTFHIREISGEIFRKAATVVDITERKLMEEQLYRYNQEMISLFDLFQKASEQVALDELLHEAQLIIAEHFSPKGISFYLYNEQTENLTLSTSHGVRRELLDDEDILADQLGLHYNVYLFKESRVAAVSKFKDHKIKEYLLVDGIHYIGCFPILYADKILGVLFLGLESDQDLALDNKEFVMAICNQLAVLINNWRLYENLKQELQMRKKAENENELIFNTSIDLLAILDMDMKLIRIGPHWKKCLGWNEDELLDHCIMDFVHADDRDETLNFFDMLGTEGIVIGYENRLICKDGFYRWFAWNAQVVRENNKRLIVVTGRDVTRNKEIEAKNRDLEQAYHVETLKMEFFANISHEFRTPLNIILSAIQLIQYNLTDNTSPLQERFLRHSKSIKQNALRLLRLVNNLIDITKLDSGYMKIFPRNYDIVNVVESITQSVAQYIEGKGISLLFDTDVEEKIIACDADMIERILLNLLSNAVKFTEKGGLIKVVIKDLGSALRISVHDTGVGIAEEKLDYIFERFAQVDRPLSKRCEGSGIGLSLVKSLVELHKGRVYANSTLNKGSEFAFELPVTVLDSNNDSQTIPPSNEERIHKINVEFSDIYMLNS